MFFIRLTFEFFVHAIDGGAPMRKLNIFVVHPSDSLTDHLPNGAGWIVYNYLRGLAERGHVLHVATPRAEMRDALPAGLHLHRIPQHGGALGSLQYLAKVRALLQQLRKSIRFDIAHQFTPVQTGLSLSMLASGVPLVLGPYSGFWPADADGPAQIPGFVSRCKMRIRDSLAAIQQSQAAALIVTCPAALERISAKRALDARLHVISHGIDSRGYREREQLPDTPSILFLANLEYRKGIFALLEAFGRVADAVPGSTLEIWGDGPEAARIDDVIAQSPHRQRIHRRGRAPRERVGEIMRSHALYCMASHGEPFGMTLLEAMASGVPVVTTDAGGPPYFVHRDGGRVVPMREPARLAEALIEVLSDREEQRRMGHANRQRIEREFDWSRQLDRMESVYARVLRAGEPSMPETRWSVISGSGAS